MFYDKGIKKAVRDELYFIIYTYNTNHLTIQNIVFKVLLLSFVVFFFALEISGTVPKVKTLFLKSIL